MTLKWIVTRKLMEEPPPPVAAPPARLFIHPVGSVSTAQRKIWNAKISKVAGVTFASAATDPKLTHVLWSAKIAPDASLPWFASIRSGTIAVVTSAWIIWALRKKRRPSAAQDVEFAYIAPAPPPAAADLAVAPPQRKRSRGGGSAHVCDATCAQLPGHRDRRWSMMFRATMRNSASPNNLIVAAHEELLALTAVVGAEQNKQRAYVRQTAYHRTLAVLRAWPNPLFVGDDRTNGVDEAQLALFLASEGVGPRTGKRIGELADYGALVTVTEVRKETPCLELRRTLAQVHGIGHILAHKLVKSWRTTGLEVAVLENGGDPISYLCALVRCAEARAAAAAAADAAQEGQIPRPTQAALMQMVKDGVLRVRPTESGAARLCIEFAPVPPRPPLALDVHPTRDLESDLDAILASTPPGASGRNLVDLLSMEVRKGLRHHVAFKEGISPSEVEWVTAELGAVIAAHTEDEAWQLMPTFEIVGSRRRQPNRCDGRKDLDVLFSCKPPRGRRDGGGFRCGWPRDIIAESQYEKDDYELVETQMNLLLSALHARGSLQTLMKEGSSGKASGMPQVHHCIRHAVFAVPAEVLAAEESSKGRRAVGFESESASSASSSLVSFAAAADASDATGSPPLQRSYRRVDLVVVPHQDRAAAVLGWSGSRQFERAIRNHTKGRLPGQLSCKTETQDTLAILETEGSPRWSRWASGPGQRWQLSQSGLHAVTCDSANVAISVQFSAKATSEEEIFQLLGLEYIPPTERNV